MYVNLKKIPLLQTPKLYCFCLTSLNFVRTSLYDFKKIVFLQLWKQIDRKK